MLALKKTTYCYCCHSTTDDRMKMNQRRLHRYFWCYAVNNDCNVPKWHSWISHCIWPVNIPLVFYSHRIVLAVVFDRCRPHPFCCSVVHEFCKRQRHPVAMMAFWCNLSTHIHTHLWSETGKKRRRRRWRFFSIEMIEKSNGKMNYSK